jgi:hypothetical protein
MVRRLGVDAARMSRVHTLRQRTGSSTTTGISRSVFVW